LGSKHTEMPQGLFARTSVADSAAWIDEHVVSLEYEEILLAQAAGRVLAQDAVTASELPPFDRAAVDGIAVRADETAGAGTYNPLSFPLSAMVDGALPAAAGLRLGAGDPLPAGADAVVPLEHVGLTADGSCEIIDAVAAGSGVERKACHFRRDAVLLPAGRRLHPHDLGLLAVAGVSRLRVVRCPRVRCFLAMRSAAGSAAAPAARVDANGPQLRALIQRDGGSIAALREVGRNSAAIAGALAEPDADIVIVAGGTGRGLDDETVAALAATGELAIHGVALRPGESAGVGRRHDGVPVFLLPGAPAACLWAYELLAGRALRRLAGRDPALPFPTRRMTTAGKIVSSIGTTEVCPVRRLSDDRVEPIASLAGAGLAAAADGFVIVAEGSEGIPRGASATVYLYDHGPRPAIDRETEWRP
jgi:molybdopterin molybdotransferase